MQNLQLHGTVSSIGKTVVPDEVACCQEVCDLVTLWGCSGIAAVRQTYRYANAKACAESIHSWLVGGE